MLACTSKEKPLGAALISKLNTQINETPEPKSIAQQLSHVYRSLYWRLVISRAALSDSIEPDFVPFKCEFEFCIYLIRLDKWRALYTPVCLWLELREIYQLAIIIESESNWKWYNVRIVHVIT